MTAVETYSRGARMKSHTSQSTPGSNALRLSAVSKTWRDGERQRVVLEQLDLNLPAGSSCAIIGPSGCGKTTLLNICSGIEPADCGEIRLGDFVISHAGEKALSEFRMSRIGRVFQFFQLLPTLNLAENVALPLSLAGKHNGSLRRASEALAQIGLQGLDDRFPDQVSGGEQQRAAIARALIHRPALVVADEPTGNLDATTASQISDLLFEHCADSGASLLLATHSTELASRAEQRLRLVRGQLEPA